MPPLDVNSEKSFDDESKTLAVMAEVLYLMNLLILPVLAFIILSFLFFRYRHTNSVLAACHLRQAFSASIWAGVVLIVVSLLVIFLGGFNSVMTWLFVIIYFTTVHASLVIMGTLALAKAMSAKHYHYPVIGSACVAVQS